MKLLIVSPRFLPEPFSIGEIAKELVRQGHNVTVLTGRPNYGKWKFYDGYEKYQKYENIEGIKIIRVKTMARKRNLFLLAIAYIDVYFKYKRELKRIKSDFDAVISHALSPLLVLNGTPKFCKKRKIPNMLYGLDLWPESFVAAGVVKKNSFLYKILKKYSKKFYKKFNLIAYASPSANKFIKEELNVVTNFTHIYQPCINKIPDDEIVGNHLYYKDGKLHILYCGTIAKFIHIDLIIKAIKICKNKDNIIFDIVGSGIDDQKAFDLIQTLELSNSVIMHGRIAKEGTVKFYKNADVLFVPLFNNSGTGNMIPQKLIEYFSYNRPILGMIKGDGKDLLENASKINFVADQTVESIADSIDKIFLLKADELEKCGYENRSFFFKNPRFQLKNVCIEIIDSIVNHNEK